MEDKKFGERLKKLRKEANITQNDFADKLLVHSQTVSRWERGVIEPDISQLGEIAATLHITLEKLFDLPESEKTYEGAFDPVSFGKTLGEKRTQKGESQELLADDLADYNVSSDTVSRWERGVTCPDISQLIALSQHFDCPVSELYCGMSEKDKSESESVVYVKKHKIAAKIVAAAVVVGCLLTGAGIALMIMSARNAVYTLSFDGETVNVSSSQVYTPETPQRTGYDFLGWANANGEMVRFPRTFTKNCDYYSVFTPHEYYIDYWLNGGEFAEEPAGSITVESGEITLNTPQKTGAAFEGWYLEADYSGEAVASIQCDYSDVKLYARWSDAVYTVRYELYGGTMYDVNPDTVTVWEEIALFSPVKKGHKFAGWFDSPVGNNEKQGENANKITSVGGKNAKNLTLYAAWQKTDEKYSVIYDSQGGTMQIDNPGTLQAGEICILSGAEKSGYEFMGWNDLPDGSGVYYEKLYDLQADLKLYAIFRAKKYLIRYEYTGAYENDKINPNIISYEDTVKLYPVNKRGYEFTGWYSEKTGGTKIDTIDSENVTSLFVLYARYTPITYTLKLDADGGCIELSASESKETERETYEYYLTVESASFYLPSCKKAGYEFVCWRDKENGEALDKIGAIDIKNRTLTAIWRDSEKTYKIKYVLGIAGADNPNPSEAKCKNILYLDEAEANGYEFIGWYDNAEGNGAQITKIEKGNEKDITLYALWQELKTYGSTEFFDYEETSAGVTITNYKGAFGSNVTVNVPAYINGSPVVALNCRFKNGSERVTYKAINLPDGIVMLGDSAFTECTVLNEIKIPASVKEIGYACFSFASCGVYFDENSTVKTIRPYTFAGLDCSGVLVLPKTIKIIEEYAFSGASLVGIVLPDGLQIIGDHAFLERWEGQCVIFVPDTIKYIGEGALGDYAYTALSESFVRNNNLTDATKSFRAVGVSKSVLTLCDGNKTIITEEDYAFLLPRCEKDGYRFIGWTDEKNMVVNEYYVPVTNRTLKAKYVKISESDGLSESTPMIVEAGVEYEAYISRDLDFYFALNTQKTVKVLISWIIAPDEFGRSSFHDPVLFFGENIITGNIFEYTCGRVLKIGIEHYWSRPPYTIKLTVKILS